MKKSTLLKLSPIMLLLSLLAGSANIAFADEKAAETTADIEKAAGEAASDAKDDAADGDKKKDGKEEPDCD